jgi:tetratricopeptide (TPR) repeat protein
MLKEVLKRACQSLFRARQRKAVPTEPASPPIEDLSTLLGKAGKSHADGALEEALRMYQAALDLLPLDQLQAIAAIRLNMGVIQRELVRLPQALDSFREAVNVAPDLAAAQFNLGLTLYEAGEIQQAETRLRAAIALDPGLQAAHSALLCLYAFTQNRDSARVLAEHREWAGKFADPITAVAPGHKNDLSLERRLTIGYVSADFKEHSIARFIDPIFSNHDRSRFRIIGYDNWARSDETTLRLREQADIWRKIDQLNDDEVAQLVRADGVDILVDLSGHTTGHRLLMFARKPAPVQASWLGYMCTTGMSAMDWHITDAYLDPPGSGERRYVERLAYVDSAAAFAPHPDSPPVGTLPSLTTGFIRFGSFNNYAKIGDPVIALWARLLAELPDARILLVLLGGDEPDVQTSVRARFERLATVQGISRRVEIIGRRGLKEFLHLFHRVDIALDPFPCSGGTTSLHSLWMGVPLVALEGNAELARGTSSMLLACGYGDLVAHDEKEYFQLNIKLARNTRRLADIRESLRERMSGMALFDGAGVTRSLESAYLDMWSDYVRSKSA